MPTQGLQVRRSSFAVIGAMLTINLLRFGPPETIWIHQNGDSTWVSAMFTAEILSDLITLSSADLVPVFAFGENDASPPEPFLGVRLNLTLHPTQIGV